MWHGTDLCTQRHPRSSRQACRLVARCRNDAGDEGARFIFLGDYLDRGPNSRGVIEYLMDFQRQQSGDVVCLCGNHEDLALSAIDDPSAIDQWVARNSGDTTLRSYGVAAPAELPAGHVEWLRALGTQHDDGRRFFVHAGVNRRWPLWIARTDMTCSGCANRFCPIPAITAV